MPRTDIEDGEREQDFFARTWTRKERLLLGALGILVAVLIALIIALPVVFMGDRNDHDGDDWQPFKPKHDDPSYKVARNRPILALWNFPDPGLIRHNDTWYAFGTNPRTNDPNTIHVPVATSNDFMNWTLHENYDAMPTIGGWEREINHWAPDAIQRVSERLISLCSASSLDPNPPFRTMGSLFSTTLARPKALADTTASAPRYPKVMALLGLMSH